MHCCLATVKKLLNIDKQRKKNVMTHSKIKTYLISCNSLPYIVILAVVLHLLYE